MKIFVKNDAAYLEWAAANPAGYVVNTDGRHGTSYAVLHRATCGQISGAARANYTTGQYIKVCATGLAELNGWASAETTDGLNPCGLCRPNRAVADTTPEEQAQDAGHGFEYWIRGYQNFYEPMILAHFRDLGHEATKEASSIERTDLDVAAANLKNGLRQCNLNAGERQKCIEHFESRKRIQTDGIVCKTDSGVTRTYYSLECKSWGGFCSAADTISYFMGPGGWFMLVKSIRGKSIAGSILVVGGKRPDNHDALVSDLKRRYLTKVEVYYQEEIFARPGPNLRTAMRDQMARLDRCVANIRKDLNSRVS